MISFVFLFFTVVNVNADVVNCVHESDCPRRFCPPPLHTSCVGLRCKCTA
uniref:Nodule-specific cysteine-rich peptide L44 n=1 Tax=Lens culinaris TaxID=3864 RepID=A0A7T8IG33_LENCU|nr:nodule-specific cysteine-rich peptide L44 [Lens culinaris]